MTGTVTDNVAKNRYELPTEDGVAVAYYEPRRDAVAFTHTMVPDAMQGRGLASTLIKAALADMRGRGLKIVPECPFVAAYIERHPEERDLVAD